VSGKPPPLLLLLLLLLAEAVEAVVVAVARAPRERDEPVDDPTLSIEGPCRESGAAVAENVVLKSVGTGALEPCVNAFNLAR
jgi:hypothetical protein